MGQQTVGIFYGCVAPELPETDERPEPIHDLVERWKKAKHIGWSAHDKPAIRIESEGGKTLLGVWVAIGGSGKDGAPYFLDEAMSLSVVEVYFAKRIREAMRLWSRFAKYVADHEGITLPEPTLWLTPGETA